MLGLNPTQDSLQKICLTATASSNLATCLDWNSVTTVSQFFSRTDAFFGAYIRVLF